MTSKRRGASMPAALSRRAPNCSASSGSTAWPPGGTQSAAAPPSAVTYVSSRRWMYSVNSAKTAAAPAGAGRRRAASTEDRVLEERSGESIHDLSRVPRGCLVNCDGGEHLAHGEGVLSWGPFGLLRTPNAARAECGVAHTGIGDLVRRQRPSARWCRLSHEVACCCVMAAPTSNSAPRLADEKVPVLGRILRSWRRRGVELHGVELRTRGLTDRSRALNRQCGVSRTVGASGTGSPELSTALRNCIMQRCESGGMHEPDGGRTAVASAHGGLCGRVPGDASGERADRRFPTRRLAIRPCFAHRQTADLSAMGSDSRHRWRRPDRRRTDRSTRRLTRQLRAAPP